VEQSNIFLATVRSRVRIPSVIQIAYYIRKPYTKPKFSKKSIFLLKFSPITIKIVFTHYYKVGA